MTSKKHLSHDWRLFLVGGVVNSVVFLLLASAAVCQIYVATAHRLAERFLLAMFLVLLGSTYAVCNVKIFRSILILLRITAVLSADCSIETDLLNLHQKKFLFPTVKAISDIRSEDFIKKQESALAQKNVEFSVLQSQINPHFLYNTLESIRSEAIEQNAPQIAHMVKALSSYYRYSIDTRNHIVTFQEELRNLQNYFTIQQFRFGDRIALELQISPEDQVCYQFPILKMTLQPIVENAIFHGLETKSGKGMLTIAVERTERSFLITISDNGTGIPADKLAEINEALHAKQTAKKSAKLGEAPNGAGLALVNVNWRIKLFFGQEYGLILRSIEGIGTDVEIALPAESFRNL